jgi:hypothetical protein
MTHVLAIDPGATAGAALLDSYGAVVAWWAWSPTTTGYRVRGTGMDDGGLGVANMRRVGETVVRLAAWFAPQPRCVVVERIAIHLGRRVKASSIITLAESTGELIGPLRDLGEVHRIDPATWAALCGGLGPRQTERARTAALRLRWEVEPPTLETVPNSSAFGAVFEACMMGRAHQTRG